MDFLFLFIFFFKNLWKANFPYEKLVFIVQKFFLFCPRGPFFSNHTFSLLLFLFALVYVRWCIQLSPGEKEKAKFPSDYFFLFRSCYYYCFCGLPNVWIGKSCLLHKDFRFLLSRNFNWWLKAESSSPSSRLLFPDITQF